MSGMLAGLDVVFVAVPGADDVGVLAVILERAHRAVGRRRLHDALHDPALAHRSAAVSAFVVPSVKFAVDHEDSDLGVAAFEQEAAALPKLFDPAGAIFAHETEIRHAAGARLPPPRCAFSTPPARSSRFPGAGSMQRDPPGTRSCK